MSWGKHFLLRQSQIPCLRRNGFISAKQHSRILAAEALEISSLECMLTLGLKYSPKACVLKSSCLAWYSCGCVSGNSKMWSPMKGLLVLGVCLTPALMLPPSLFWPPIHGVSSFTMPHDPSIMCRSNTPIGGLKTTNLPYRGNLFSLYKLTHLRHLSQ